MSKIQLETEDRPETELEPTLRRMVLTQLGKLQALKRQLKAIEAQEAEVKRAIEALFVKAKEDHLLIEGVRVQGASLKTVCGLYESWDEKKFLARGLNPADFKVTKPKKPYLSITLPKDEMVVESRQSTVPKRGRKEPAESQPDFMGK